MNQLKQAELLKKPLAHIVREWSPLRQEPGDAKARDCVQRYFQFIQKVQARGVRLIAWSVILSSSDDVQYGLYSTIGFCMQRNEVSIPFTRHLLELCARYGVTCLSGYGRLVDADGLTDPRYYRDPIHLSPKALPLVHQAFVDCGFLPAADSQLFRDAA